MFMNLLDHLTMYLLVILANFARLFALTHDIIIALHAPMVRNEVEFP